MSKLPYIEACLRETLRLTPTAPAIALQALPDSTGNKVSLAGGKYEITPGRAIICLLPKIHRDPAVYGDDAESFIPERMLDEPFSKLPNNSWKPFVSLFLPLISSLCGSRIRAGLLKHVSGDKIALELLNLY
jgi:cytochrome P450/NADPH-cytochrome P450 reductase